MAYKKQFCAKGHEFTEENTRIIVEKTRTKRICKICNNTYHRERSKRERNQRFMENPEWASRYYRDRKLKECYGITLEQFDQMIKDQDNKCFICKFTFSIDSFASKPCVDHCHKTNKVRKILCHSCNRGIGLLKENPAVLRATADYIESYQ